MKLNFYLFLIGIWIAITLLLWLIIEILVLYHSGGITVNYTPLAETFFEYVIWSGVILAILFRIFFLSKIEKPFYRSWIFTIVLILLFPTLLVSLSKTMMVAHTKHFGEKEFLVAKVTEKYETKSSGRHRSKIYNLRIDSQRYGYVAVRKKVYNQAYIGQTVNLIAYKSQFLDCFDFDDVELVR